MNTRRIPLCVVLIVAISSALASSARAVLVITRIATKGEPYAPRADDWPEGAMELVSHPLRDQGWHRARTGDANDRVEFELKVRDSSDVQELIDLLAKVKAGVRCVVLSPDAQYLLGPAALRPVPPAVTPTGAAFSIGSQGIINKWYERLPKDETGARKFGAHRYEKPPTARPPTLTFYVGSEALEDLTKIRVPADVELRPAFNDVWGKQYQWDWRVKRIVQFVAQHNAKINAAQKQKNKAGAP